jgi:hypothetical protein
VQRLPHNQFDRRKATMEPKTGDVMFSRSNVAIHGGTFNNNPLIATNRVSKGV